MGQGVLEFLLVRARSNESRANVDFNDRRFQMNREDPRDAKTPNCISPVTRRAIIDALLLRDESYHGRQMGHVDFLNRVLPLDSLPSTDSRFGSLHDDLIQHTVRNYDYSELEVLSRHAKIFSVPDAVFGHFLSETLHPIVRDSEVERGELLSLYNTQLRPDGFEIAPAGQMSGRPLFALRRVGLRSAGTAHSATATIKRTSTLLPGSSRDSLEAQFYAIVPNALTAAEKPTIPPPSPAAANAETTNSNGLRKYDVVLSFAGEQRNYVERVANALFTQSVEVFYDGDNVADLWGTDLVDAFGKIYGGDAHFCVMFISSAYAKKDWANLERRHALAKAIREQEEYVLPVRFDDTVLPGLVPTTAYISANKYTPEQVADLIIVKLDKATRRLR